MNVIQKAAALFKVGDWVSFRYGTGPIVAQIMEDRGPIGVNGRRLYRIRRIVEDGEEVAFEVPEQDLSRASFEKTRVIEYFKRGALLDILGRNLSGGRNQPRAWLTFNPLGNITHTFIPGCGLVGGEEIPFMALHADRIFLGKETEVIDYLTSFGLTPDDAQDIIASVGTSPARPLHGRETRTSP